MACRDILRARFSHWSAAEKSDFFLFFKSYFVDKPKASAKQKLRAFAFWNSDYPGGRANIRGELNVSEKSRISS